jgi:hypothetical protein
MHTTKDITADRDLTRFYNTTGANHLRHRRSGQKYTPLKAYSQNLALELKDTRSISAGEGLSNR